ncbi:MAG: methylated-DNA--[protein]-cysteine S-methyltransferase [Eudoraea sp.]|nr:methylated-DNA--[protein]-cysteine S-methyltransferase [Eudoraea sp.]MBT8210012.1 methylated-DNA--[protein]-cysteine S-methyltransferase [Eudoraea sp.]
MESTSLNTPLGWARIEGNSEGLSAVTILDETPTTHEVVPEILEEAVYQLLEYFEGKRREFTLKLKFSGTPFQNSVWKGLTQIPYGKTMSYLELSKQLGDPKAVRAVAAANAKNPFWVIVPCHRVVGSDGSLTGYAGGLHRKKWLLDHEQGSHQQMLF